MEAATRALADRPGRTDVAGHWTECATLAVDAYLEAVDREIAPKFTAAVTRALELAGEVERLRLALERCRDARLATPDAGWIGESPHLIAQAALEGSA
jgi:hypothetical protein